ncbi:hypothetical protein Hypma_007495 [Hypsizygus marmoreus]|uniref:Protein kinase domain-containing protein n=1 Tax=Hypsizygus marmoreus TaxID=39966 RepID=A0A369JT27_HYPMA|nr:hypothetical protein Hypma_007495 [Hypsizygus marmoreus]
MSNLEKQTSLNPWSHPDNLMRHGKLCEGEIFWRDHQPWLQDQGYMLRSRFRPGWVASWLDSPTKSVFAAEDGISAVKVFQIVDATRADGSAVALKRIKRSRHPNEAAIGKLFSSAPLSFMPLLYDNEIPPFETIGEVVEFFRQIFEGLQFMHENQVCHRDCKYDNILADIVPLYHSRPHPWHTWRTYDYSGDVKKRSSRTRTPIRYYLADFGLSKIYKPEDAPHLEPLGWGGDRTVPEFQTSDYTLCDPFPVDVYCLGNAIRENFIDGAEGMATAKKGFDFMRELVDDMVNNDPKQRPAMQQVVARFDDIVEGLSNWKLRSRVADIDERPVRGAVRSIPHWMKQLGFMAMRIPPIPRP